MWGEAKKQKAQTNEQHLILQIHHSHTTQRSEGRHVRKNSAPEAVRMGRLVRQKIFALSWTTGARFVGLDPQFKSGASSEIHPHSNKRI
jgi:hypothetical protein